MDKALTKHTTIYDESAQSLPRSDDQQQQPLNPGSWPTEILTNVFVYVEWNDLLRVRRVSRRLSEASRIRFLWLGYIYKHSLQCTLRKRIDLYSAAELEDLFLGVQKAEVAFIHPDSRLSMKKIDHGLSNHWYRILPGGRWVLAEPMSSDGGVLYLDLDATPKWRRLIEIPPSSGLKIRYCIDYNPDAPYFRLEITLATEDPSIPVQELQVIEMWRVTPTFNQDGVIDGLQAARVRQLSLGFQQISVVYSHRGQTSYIGKRPVDSLHGRSQFVQQVVAWKGTAGGEPELRLSFDLSEHISYGPEFTMPLFDHHSLSLYNETFIFCDHSRARAQDTDTDILQDQIVWTVPALEDIRWRASLWNPTYIGNKAYISLYTPTRLYTMCIDLAQQPATGVKGPEITPVEPWGPPMSNAVTPSKCLTRSVSDKTFSSSRWDLSKGAKAPPRGVTKGSPPGSEEVRWNRTPVFFDNVSNRGLVPVSWSQRGLFEIIEFVL